MWLGPASHKASALITPNNLDGHEDFDLRAISSLQALRIRWIPQLGHMQKSA
ncbi:hypothetical protein D3C71_953670 [compost metagenome]